MRLLFSAVGCATIAVAATSSHGFVHFSAGFGGSKWGPDPTAGTPAVVTWGFMPDGTTVEPDFELDPIGFPGQTGFDGTSDLSSLRERIDVTQGHGAGAFDAALQRAFDTWSRRANITFVGPVNDPGLPFPADDAVTPDIRIGAFLPQAGHSFNFFGAVGFGPPGFGPDPLAGDILFNLGATIDIVAGVEDTTPLPPFTNDLEGLFLHELGHAAIGLGHPPWEGDDPDQRVMYVGEFGNDDAPPCCQTINRELHPDDQDGAWYAYGIRGDFNADNTVDLLDLDTMGTNFGAGPGAGFPGGDANGDGFVDLLDLDLLGANFRAVRPTAPGNAPAAIASDDLPGDFNDDNVVDLLDLDIMGFEFLLEPSSQQPVSDMNGDGVLDLLDFDLFGMYFGAERPTASGVGPAAIPEPCSALLGLLAIMLTARSKRRRVA